MEVCKEPDFIEAVEKLKGELPADDHSHFDMAGAASKGADSEDDTIDTLYRDYDAIVDQDLSEKSDEYQELREKIRQFIEDKELDVRISRTKNNLQLLQEIEEAMDAPSGSAPAAIVDEPVDEPAPAPAPAPEAEKDEEEEAPRRQRRPRPGAEIPAAEEKEEAPAEEEPETKAEEEAPRRRLHARRMR